MSQRQQRVSITASRFFFQLRIINVINLNPPTPLMCLKGFVGVSAGVKGKNSDTAQRTRRRQWYNTSSAPTGRRRTGGEGGGTGRTPPLPKETPNQARPLKLETCSGSFLEIALLW